jgi:hypothetical protein
MGAGPANEAYVTYQPAPMNLGEKKYPISHLVTLQKSKMPKMMPFSDDISSNIDNNSNQQKQPMLLLP